MYISYLLPFVDRDCGRRIMQLNSCYPEQAQFHLISEPKLGWAWPLLGWETT